MKNHSLVNSIIVTGSIAYDDIMNFPSHFIKYIQPDKLHQINVSFVVDKLEKQLGGTAINIAYDLKLVTDKQVVPLGGIGKDGNIFLDFLRKNNIDTKGILEDKSIYTASGKVITDLDNNQIWGFYYGASIRGKDIDLAKYVTEESVLVMSATHCESFLHFQTQAIELGVKYLYDPGMIITTLSPKAIAEGMLHATWIVGNDYEISQILKLTGLKWNDLLQKGISVITTMGEKGATYQSRDEELHVPAYKVTKVIDPTGAGDAWRAGFIAGVVEGLSTLDSLKQANALASFAVEQYGTVNHRPRREEVKERMRKLT